VFVRPALTQGTPKIGRKWGPRAPQISSDGPRKSLDFEIGVGDRMGTLKVPRSKRLILKSNKRARDHIRPRAGPTTCFILQKQKPKYGGLFLRSIFAIFKRPTRIFKRPHRPGHQPGHPVLSPSLWVLRSSLPSSLPLGPPVLPPCIPSIGASGPPSLLPFLWDLRSSLPASLPLGPPVLRRAISFPGVGAPSNPLVLRGRPLRPQQLQSALLVIESLLPPIIIQ
jgi:hypothetical protein